MKDATPIITLDAKGQVLGRLASRIAKELIGKNSTGYAANMILKKRIVVNNAGGLMVTGNKAAQKVYHHHSGYLGGLKTETFENIFAKDPGEVLRRAVEGMLPKNRLQKDRLRMLEIHS